MLYLMVVDGVYNVFHPGGIGFEGIDGCKAWPCERPGKISLKVQSH